MEKVGSFKMLIKLLFFHFLVSVINCKNNCEYGNKTSKTYIEIQCAGMLSVLKDMSGVYIITFFYCLSSDSSEVYDLLPEFNDVEIIKSEKVWFAHCRTPPSYSDFLRNFPNMTELYLSNLSPPQVANNNFFDEATNLTIFNINGLNGTEFNNSTFATMTNLKDLSLDKIFVPSLEKSFFRNNAKLYSFSLTNNLRSLSIGDDLFANKPYLTLVDLSYNQIKSGFVSFENMFKDSTNISIVDFSHNQISGFT